MAILVMAVLLALVTTLLAGLVWLTLRIFKFRRHARGTAKSALCIYAAALPLLLFLVLPLLTSYFIANASTRPMDLTLIDTPMELGRPFETISFPSRDGLALSAWYLPGEDSKPPIVFAHGLFRNRQEVREIACRMNELGYPGLLFDFRNHGKSSKGSTTLGRLERLDILGAVDFLKKAHGADQVFLLGISMGAVSSIMAASDEPDSIAGIVADSPFDTLQNTVSQHVWLLLRLPRFPFSNLFVWNLERLGEFSGADLDAVKALQSLSTVPVLLVYGQDDQRMPETVATRLYDAAASPNKKLFIVPGAGHGQAFRTNPDKYVKAVADFVSTF
ncbi:MAG TPA: alpha/beta fold hydrolase [Acidobacteriota bacterium]|nr:alpha/beta fold hydrolase [Acidobacteriota bacterium]